MKLVHVEKLTAERASLTAGAEEARAGRYTSAARTRGLQVATATPHGKTSAVGRAVRLLIIFIAAGKDGLILPRLGLTSR